MSSRKDALRGDSLVPHIDLAVLAAHVRAIIANPHGGTPSSTGHPALDDALADLAYHCRSADHHSEAHVLSGNPPFWLTPVPAHVPCQ